MFKRDSQYNPNGPIPLINAASPDARFVYEAVMLPSLFWLVSYILLIPDAKLHAIVILPLHHLQRRLSVQGASQP